MKNLLRLEELAQFAVCLIVLIISGVPWWAYLLLLLGPDIGMIGYVISSKVGAATYNLLHHKGIAILVGAIGGTTNYLMLMTPSPEHFEQAVLLTGIILYGHASLDRVIGYGMKFSDSFHHTHLGRIGKASKTKGASE